MRAGRDSNLMAGPIANLAGHFFVTLILGCGMLAQSPRPPAALLTVRHVEGLVYGFLLLRTSEGETIATGELTEAVRGDRVSESYLAPETGRREDALHYANRRNRMGKGHRTSPRGVRGVIRSGSLHGYLCPDGNNI
jgi:hypothetical protein